MLYVALVCVEADLTRNILRLALGGLLLGACADPEMEKRIADLEKQVAEMKTPVAAPGTAASAKTPGTPPAAPAANEAEEQAAANVLKEATQLSEEMKYEEAKAKVAELNEKYPQSRAARAAQRLSAELDIIGKPAIDLKVEKWFQGQEQANVNSGKATLLVFWEVWCPHCKREVPKLVETYEKYKGQGFNVVGLTKMTRDVTEDQVTSFIKEQKISYPIGKEQGDEMSQYFGVRGIPAAAVVKDGKVVWRGHPARVTDEMIKGWLGT